MTSLGTYANVELVAIKLQLVVEVIIREESTSTLVEQGNLDDHEEHICSIEFAQATRPQTPITSLDSVIRLHMRLTQH